MDGRTTRAHVARETLEILDKGFYESLAGQVVHIKGALEAAISGSVHYRPTDFDEVFALRDHIMSERCTQPATEFEVANETTLGAAERLTQADGNANVPALNFASAKNTGGGFLNGSQAQEESLARASGLYPCIAQMQAMYDVNKGFRSCLYTDNMIYSPKVPVFRDDRDHLLEAPYLVSFVTAPAVNAGVVRRREPENVPRIENVMRGRMEKVLSLLSSIVTKRWSWGPGAVGCSKTTPGMWLGGLVIT